ncbi:MAG: IclR family transcriptional regulator [Dehalobacterium sp.]
MDNNKYLLSSVSNTLDVLDLLSKHDELGVAEISKELNMGKSIIFRMLYTLEKKAYVQKTPQAKYKLGIKFAHYGSIVLSRQNEFSIIKPYLQKLRDEFNEATHWAILDSDYQNIIIIDRELSNTPIQMASRAGAKLPSYASATGKVLLAGLLNEDTEKNIRALKLEPKTDNTIIDHDKLIAELKKIKAQGFGIDFEEGEGGRVCFAAPILDINNETFAAISISGASDRMRKNEELLIKSIKDSAEEISKTLGHK